MNEYKRPFNDRRTGLQRFAVTAAATGFKQAVALFARRESLVPETSAERDQVRYGLYVTVVLGPGQRGDGDNFWKCIADGLKDAGVIHSDARVRVWHLEVIDDERDRGPCTEILCTIEPKRGPRMRRVSR